MSVPFCRQGGRRRGGEAGRWRLPLMLAAAMLLGLTACAPLSLRGGTEPGPANAQRSAPEALAQWQESAPGKPAVTGRRGAVTSRSLLASRVGARVLADGGNAIDAAVATGFALAVTYPSAGNLGGGGFLVIRLADGNVIANDHREVAPAAATRDMYLDRDGKPVPGLSTRSHLAVGVPGTVAGLLDVLDRYGTRSRAQVLAPAIALARDGFALTADLAEQFNREREPMARYPQSLAVFTKPDGTPWRAGELFRQSDLAVTLQRIADHGRDGFYRGPVADGIVAEMRAGNGLITHADLAAYRSVFRQPLRGSYRGYDIVTMPPPSSGGVLILQLLNMLEPIEVGRLGVGHPDLVHRMIEAERRAYADRAEHLGDPAFHPVPIARLIDKAYARERMADVDPQRATRSERVGAGRIAYESPETTHASVVDAAGNAVAYTTTLNLGYGAKIVAAGTGVLLNNEMDDFSSKPNTPNSFGLLGRVANEIAPGKRMLSSMTPTIVLRDGKLVLVTGSPGGSTIITTVLQVVLNSLDHGMPIDAAVAAPRFHHQWQPDRVLVEPDALSATTRATLTARGHDIVPLPFAGGIGDANSIRLTDGVLHATHDPRNDGGAVAF